eukprot:4774651-Prymnesium_polylepis.1
MAWRGAGSARLDPRWLEHRPARDAVGEGRVLHHEPRLVVLLHAAHAPEEAAHDEVRVAEGALVAQELGDERR